jgi:hypothetical protein
VDCNVEHGALAVKQKTGAFADFLGVKTLWLNVVGLCGIPTTTLAYCRP